MLAMQVRDIARYQGCGVYTCANKLRPPRDKSAYSIRDFCRHHQSGACPYKSEGANLEQIAGR
jgi:hypothetical protein